MIPTGIAAVIGFFFFVVPGLVWEGLVERRRPERSESTFREASRVALISTPFSALAVAITFAGAWLLNHNWLAVIASWFTSGKAQSGEALLVAAVLAAAELCVALILVGIAWITQAQRLYGPPVTLLQQNAWDYSLANAPDDQVVMATVYLSGGSGYRGQVLAFSNDLAWTNREIVLGQPLSVFQPGRGLFRMPEQFVTVPSASIVAITSMYMTKQQIEGAATVE